MAVMLRPLLLLALYICSVTAQSNTEPQCACTFEGAPEEEPNCAVYGQNENDELLIDWFPVNELCLAELAIAERVISRNRLLRMCPNANETDASVTNFITLLRAVDTPLSNYFKTNANFTRFFQTNLDGTVGLADEITSAQSADNIYAQSNIVKYNCTTQENFCWNEITLYFTREEYLLGLICQDIYSQQSRALELEQSLARAALCLVQNVPEDCKESKAQIVAYQADNPETVCTDVGVRAAASSLPDPDTCNADERVLNGGGGGSGAGATLWVGMLSWASVVWLGMRL